MGTQKAEKCFYHSTRRQSFSDYPNDVICDTNKLHNLMLAVYIENFFLRHKRCVMRGSIACVKRRNHNSMPQCPRQSSCVAFKWEICSRASIINLIAASHFSTLMDDRFIARAEKCFPDPPTGPHLSLASSDLMKIFP